MKFSIGAGLIVTLALIGCTQKFYDGFTSGPKEDAKKKSLFSFQHEAVTEILIAKNDLVTGDHWTARIRRPDSASTDWEIVSTPETHDLIDRRADGNYILHLLDTLGTLGGNDVAQSGPLETFGLNPPLFAIRWTAPEGEFEVHLGAASAKSNVTYARVPATEHIYVVNGAALQMLSYLKSFDTLRYRQLSTWTSDQVDEIEFRKSSRTVFYAQRDGSDWTDRSHRRVRIDVDSLLEGLTHARIKTFIDDETATRKLLPTATKHPLYEVVFRDRHHQSDRLTLAENRSGGARELIATTSTRPNAVFALFPEAKRLFMVQSH